MNQLVARFRSQITGVLSGFDRLVFRGTLMPLVRDNGMYAFLCRAGVRLLDFGPFVRRTSDEIKDAALVEAHGSKRPVRYLKSSKTNKEDLVRHLLAEHPVDAGLVCTLTTVEPCMSFEYHRSKDLKARGLKLVPRKCLHLYKYFLHPELGLVGSRLETWFPFNVQVWLNGREWLAVQLQRKGIEFKRSDNCFTWLGDAVRAQALMDKQLATDWTKLLTKSARALNPLHGRIFKPWPMDYYWSAYQSEWATDVMFQEPKTLAAVYPALVQHAMLHFSSPDVMRFLGRKAPGHYTGEITTSFKDRAEGVRVKHWADGNSIKMYDKAGSVLRVETTIANPSGFKVFRPLSTDPSGQLAWLPMRKGIADMHRRAQVSQRANDSYLDALSKVDDATPLSVVFDEVGHAVVRDGHRSRAIRIGDRDDIALLKAICHGEFATNGMRNRDLQRLLHPVCPTREVRRRVSAKIGRRLRLLRAHGLIRKVQKSHRYTMTDKGHLLAAALFAARDATTKKLLRDAA